MHNLAESEAVAKLLQRPHDGTDALENYGVWHHRNVVFCEIDTRLKLGNQIHQFLFDRLQPPRQRTIQLLCRDFRLIHSLRFDQVADSFRLRQIDPAIQKGAHGELAGFGQPRPSRHTQFHNIPQHHGRSVSRNLHHIVSCVGMRLGEVGDYHFVDPCDHSSRLFRRRKLRCTSASFH